jgi:predicted ribosomally synthesized peptide with SipW-like signal peptide
MEQQEYAQPVERRRRRRGILVFLLASSTVATIGAGAMSLALFTDSDATTGSFTTGSIDLTLDDATVFAVAGMMPGDTVNSTLNVLNSGTATLRYAMSTTENSDPTDLGSELQLTITLGACPGGAVVDPTGDLQDAAIGNPAPGPQSDERTLAPAGNENLCFSAHLPDTAGNAFEGASSQFTFTFASEQTANNP